MSSKMEGMYARPFDGVFDLNDHAAEISDIRQLGTTRLVPFVARRVRRSKVVYLNARWFLAHGIDIAIASVRSEVEAWLTYNFGVSVPDFSRDDEADYMESEITLHADRYGGTGGGVHGGSGRCGIRGRFNAKGIGRTPLISSRSDWFHSHGCMWLEECLREAISAEVLECESPVGVQPIISIIDLGMHIRRNDGSIGERRGVVVRPNVFRLGHFQRSVFFGTSGSRESDQYLDAQCVRDAAKNIFGSHTGSPSHHLLASLLSTAEQIAFCRFHRLWAGPFCSPNAGINGEAMDFGAFRSVPTWRRFRGEAGAATFGEEEAGVCGAFVELARTVERSGGEPISIQRIQEAMRSRMTRVFERECSAAFNLQKPYSISVERRLIDKLKRIYKQQQLLFDSPLDHLIKPRLFQCTDIKSILGDVAHEIEQDVRSAYEGNSWHEEGILISLSTLNRYFSRRPLLERESLLSRSLRLVRSRIFRSEGHTDLIKIFIENNVSRSRRIWPDLPSRLIVTSQGARNGMAVAYCFDVKSRTRFAWLEMPRIGKKVWIGRFTDRQTLGIKDLSTRDSICRVLFPLTADGQLCSSLDVKLPPPNFFYDRSRPA